MSTRASRRRNKQRTARQPIIIGCSRFTIPRRAQVLEENHDRLLLKPHSPKLREMNSQQYIVNLLNVIGTVAEYLYNKGTYNFNLVKLLTLVVEYAENENVLSAYAESEGPRLNGHIW